MSGLKKQVLSNAIDILLNQGNLPEKLDGKKLYGEALEGDDACFKGRLQSIPAIQWDRKRTDHGISGI